MALFPMFVDLEGKHCLVVGGGAVALRKARSLLKCGARVAAVAPSFVPGWEETDVRLVHRPFEPEDLRDAALVVAATDDEMLNRAVADACRDAHVPVNAANTPEAGTFFFPAIVRRGPLTVGVSTDGASPAASAYVRKTIEETLPGDWFGEVIEYLGSVRDDVKQNVPGEHMRAHVFHVLFEACMERQRPLTEEEFRAVCRAAKEATE